MRALARPGPGERGLTLVEVLVALAIFFVITVSVLGLYAASVSVNLGAAARTDLVYKCERVVETIRWVEALKKEDNPPDLSGFGINLTAQDDVALPTDPTDAYWGKAGADVIDPVQRYRLSYSVVDNGDCWTITVTARPKTGTGVRYIGAGINTKVVRYVAQIPK